MGRNIRTDGVILHVYRVAEYHKGLVILSPDLGVFHATAFGACKGKSKLSGVSETFIEGNLQLYHDPVKDRYKVSEIVPVQPHEHLRTDLDRYYTALFWAEMIMKSFAGGEEFPSLYRFVTSSLYQLEHVAETEQLLIQFIWRYLGLIGFQPDILVCGECGRAVDRGESLFLQNGQFVGQECGTGGDSLILSPAARNYLLYTSGLSMEKTEGVKMVQPERQALKRLLGLFIEDILGHPLNMLRKGLI